MAEHFHPGALYSTRTTSSSTVPTPAPAPVHVHGVTADHFIHDASFGFSSPTFDWNQATTMTLQNDFVQDLSSNPYFCAKAPASYGSALLLPSNPLFEPNLKHGCSSSSESSDDTNQLPSWFKFPQFFDTLSNQLHYFSDQFSDSTAAYWNPPTVGSEEFILPTLYNYFPGPNSWVPKPNRIIKIPSVSDEVRSLNNYHPGPAIKKPRIETSSSLPIFKVRKQKLSDRIAALQQLVSPFGKTDTASVLFEAIEYIKYLHYEVDALSTQYMKNNTHKQDERKRDLLSRGLCLVPIATANIPISTNQSNLDLSSHDLAASYRYTTEQMEK